MALFEAFSFLDDHFFDERESSSRGSEISFL